MDTQKEMWKYNPAVDGYDEDYLLSALTGTPAISSSKLRLTSAGVISLQGFRNGSAEFTMTIPTAPTAADDREFGFSNNINNRKMVFDITDDVFSAKVYDVDGTIIDTKVIPWDASWTAASARYRITCGDRSVIFAIDDTIVARFEAIWDITTEIIGNSSLSILISNGNADNLDVSLILFGGNVTQLNSLRAILTGTGTIDITKLGGETLGDHGTAVIDHGIQPLYEAKDYDGAALPNAVTEGQAVRPASTLSGITFTFQTNEDGSVAIIPVAHDSADSGAPLKIGGKASTSEPTAVATGDRVDGYFDEYGRLHIRSIVYDTSSGADKNYITNSLNGDYVNGFIDVDITNVGAGPTYYPSSSGISLDGYKSLSFSGKMIEADAEANTLTVQVTNDEDTTNADWQTVHFIDLITSTTTDAGSYVCNATTTQMFGLLKDLNARYVRLKFVGGASATNTLIVKVRTIPL